MWEEFRRDMRDALSLLSIRDLALLLAALGLGWLLVSLFICCFGG